MELLDRNTTRTYKVFDIYIAKKSYRIMTSYDTIICALDLQENKLTITSYYGYSNTTMKHLRRFIGDYFYQGFQDLKNKFNDFTTVKPKSLVSSMPKQLAYLADQGFVKWFENNKDLNKSISVSYYPFHKLNNY